MAIDTTLETLFQELMADYDSTIDTAEGSTFHNKVITPLLTRIGDSPLDVDLETFFVERLRTEIEGIDTSRFSGIRNTVIQAQQPIFEPLRREIKAVKVTGSIANFEQMTREELDERLGNYFTSLRDGEKTGGPVRLYFPAPQSVVVTPLNECSTGGGLKFFPTVVQSISSETMSFNQEDGLYFMEIVVESEGEGDEYNIEAGDISQIVGLAGVLRVTNPAVFADSIASETKADAVVRSQEAITLRTLSTERGIAFVYKENFNFVKVLQVIGFGQPEMQRDRVEGPVSVSEVPGGIVGDDPVDIDSVGLHIGGKTDVYLYQRAIDTAALDIQNIADKGVRKHAGSTGFTAAGGATDTFEDGRGFFVTRGVTATAGFAAGAVTEDWLLLGEDEYFIATVTEASITLLVAPGGIAAVLAGGLFGQTYEVVSRTAGVIDIPLYDLIAQDSAGAPVTDTDGDPVQPIPGSKALAQLTVSGTDVKKTENIATANIQSPLLRIATLEEIDPLTLEPTGNDISMRDVVGAEVRTGFANGDGSTEASGTVRLYFRGPVNLWVTHEDAVGGKFELTQGAYTYQVKATVAFNSVKASVTAPPSTSLVLDTTLNAADAATLAASIAIGQRIEVVDNGIAVAYMISGLAVTGAEEITVTTRETIPAAFTPSPAVQVALLDGIRKAGMTQDTTTGLYFLDLLGTVEATAIGAAGNLSVGDFFATISGVNSEGWSLKTTRSALSYSTRELPYLSFTDFIDDTIDLTDPGTDYAFRLNYEHAGDIPAVQTFAEDAENRPIGEDILNKHFRPDYVFLALEITGLETAAGKTLVEDYIRDLAPTEAMQGDDVVDTLKNAGASKVELPFTMVSLAQDEDRNWAMTVSQDTLGTNRIQHFLPDTDSISVS